MLEPIKEDINQVNKATKVNSGRIKKIITDAKDCSQEIFGCGLSNDDILNYCSSNNIQVEDISSSYPKHGNEDTEESTSNHSNVNLPPENPLNTPTFSNDPNFFERKSSSKMLLVEVRGIEPLSEVCSKKFSTSVSFNLILFEMQLKEVSNSNYSLSLV